MEGKKVCEKHSKNLEVFCSLCNGLNEPMCSICMCEHVKARHNLDGPTHIKTLIDKKLEQIVINKNNVAELQEKIKAHDNKAQNNQLEHNQSKDELDKRLAKLKSLYTVQESLASANHAKILRCHETTCKEIRKCETKIKDNQNDILKYKKKVDDLLKDNRYWEGYEVVQLGEVESKLLDDNEIKAKLNEYNELMVNNNNLLDSLKATPELISDYSQVKAENVQLKRILIFNQKNLEQLTEFQERDARNVREIQTLNDRIIGIGEF